MRLWALTACFAITAAAGAQAYVDQPLPDRDGAGALTCRACHVHKAEFAESGRLAIEGLPERYEPGRTYRLTARLSHPEMMRAGFEASVRDRNGRQAGTLSAAGAGLAVISDPASGVQFVHHTKRGTMVTNMAAAWDFTWTAPQKPAGPVTVRAAGNASNADDSPLGDAILFFSRTLDGPG